MPEQTPLSRRKVLRKTAAVGVAGVGGAAAVGTVSASCRYNQGDFVRAVSATAYESCSDDKDENEGEVSGDAVVNFCCQGGNRYGINLYKKGKNAVVPASAIGPASRASLSEKEQRELAKWAEANDVTISDTA